MLDAVVFFKRGGRCKNFFVCIGIGGGLLDTDLVVDFANLLLSPTPHLVGGYISELFSNCLPLLLEILKAAGVLGVEYSLLLSLLSTWD